jgi:recombinational DNA repair protein RecT
VMDCAQLGLEPDNVMGRAYILPYKGRAQLIVGYKGYIDLFYRSGMGQGLIAEAVYEKDHFIYRLGLDPKLEHVPAETEDRGALKYAYAVADIAGGGKVWRVLNREQVMRAKKSSQSAGSEYSPWTTNEEEMWVKTAIRALAKRIPLSPELREAIAREDTPRHRAGAGHADHRRAGRRGAQAGDSLTVTPSGINVRDRRGDAPEGVTRARNAPGRSSAGTAAPRAVLWSATRAKMVPPLSVDVVRGVGQAGGARQWWKSAAP